MEPNMQRQSGQNGYEPPALIRVHVDPVRDLLMACAKVSGQNAACNLTPSAT